MNSDTFQSLRFDYPTNHPFQTASLALSSTTETVFSLAVGGPAVVSIPLQTAILGSSAPLDPNANNAITVDSFGQPGYRRGTNRPYFNSGSFDGRAFRLRAQVKATGITTAATAGGASLKINLYQGSSATIGSDTLLFSPTLINVPISQTGVSINFLVEATLQWDVTTGKMYGEAWGNAGISIAQASVYSSRAALAQANGITAAAPANLQFVCSAVWSVNAPTASTLQLTELTLEAI